MFEALGWVATLLVLIGYYLNANRNLKWALFIWIWGDLAWLVYDIHIRNFSHFALSTIILLINLWGGIRINHKTQGKNGI